MSDARDRIEAFRAEARAWLEENFPPSLRGRGGMVGGEGWADLEGEALAWRIKLADKGWGCPTWPAQYGGGGLDLYEARVLQAEMTRIGAFNPIPMLTGIGISMVGPTILEYGTEDQKQRHVRGMARGEVRWCLGYSEPNAGSDLASLTTRAEDAGDHWIINGQKTWTSGADRSDWCGILVRTDPRAPKRDGISFLMLTMHQPGITTRPIALIAGASPFCETFFNDARAEKHELLGPLNGGWTVGKRQLQHERQSPTGAASPLAAVSRESLQDLAKRYVGVDADGRLADPDLRARLSAHLMDARAHALTLSRVADEARGKMQVGATASILKNAATSVAQARAELTVELMGNRGLGWEGEGFDAQELAAVRGWLAGKAMSIYGGSFEIQNNIISKNILGLPEKTQQG